jgi:hypothetical protein
MNKMFTDREREGREPWSRTHVSTTRFSFGELPLSDVKHPAKTRVLFIFQ